MTLAAGESARSGRRLPGAEADLGRPVPLSAETRQYVAADVEPTVRWVLLHLVEELARHAGHADVVRESVDGKGAQELAQA